MYENLRGKSCVRFTAELASSAPVPGGGSVTALLGALSASLCAMAARIRRSRAKEPAVGEARRNAAERAEALRRELLKLIDADAKAFLPLIEACALPKDTPDRAESLRKLSIEAGSVPLSMLRLCGDVTALLELLLSSTSSSLLSDVGCAAAVCRAAVDCAAMNVWVNIRSYPEDLQAYAYGKEVRKLHKDLNRRTEAVARAVREKLMS